LAYPFISISRFIRAAKISRIKNAAYNLFKTAI